MLKVGSGQDTVADKPQGEVIGTFLLDVKNVVQQEAFDDLVVAAPGLPRGDAEQGGHFSVAARMGIITRKSSEITRIQRDQKFGLLLIRTPYDCLSRRSRGASGKAIDYQHIGSRYREVQSVRSHTTGHKQSEMVILNRQNLARRQK